MNSTLAELKKNSLKLYDGMVVIYPQFHQEDILSLDGEPKFDGRHYAINNSTVAYVENDGSYYVCPWSKSAISVLRDEGFKEKSFYVPFSNWDYPKKEEETWQRLREAARHEAEYHFLQDCIAYSDEHGIDTLPDEIMENCIVIPESGIEVKKEKFNDRIYPLLTCFDCTINHKIATFNENNGIVVFIYYDGRTYVTKGRGILPVLKCKGYRRNEALFVPLSNGEIILDPSFRQKWSTIRKRGRFLL